MCNIEFSDAARPLGSLRHNWLALGLAVGTIAACVLAWALFRDAFDERFVFLFLIPPILLNTAFDGLLGGLAVTGLGLAFGLAILGTDGLDTDDITIAAGYTLIGVVNSVLGYRLHKNLKRADLAQQEIREQERSFQALQAELAHVSRVAVMGEIASSLAHEINQPLSATANYIQGCQSLLDKDPFDKTKLGDGLNRAREQLTRAGDVIASLREFLAKGDTKRAPHEPKALVEEAVALALLGQKSPTLTTRFSIAGDLPMVLVDKLQIQQVIINLIRNAMDEMKKCPGQREIAISARRHDTNTLTVSVADTGAGFDDQTARNLFTPFFTTKPDGFGIGLSISKTIVEAHGGRIWAETGDQGGAIFRFTLPVAQRAD